LYAIVQGNPVGHLDFQGLITVGEVFNAAGATFGRDGVSALAGGAVRFFAGQELTQWATRLTLAPSGVATALRTGAYGGQQFIGGYIRAELSPWAGVAISGIVEGLDGVSIVINAWRGGTYTPGTNRLSMPGLWEWMYGWSTRVAGSGLTASLTFLFTPLTNAIENANLRTGAIAMMATPTEVRTYLGQHMQRGNAALFRYDDTNFRLDQFTERNVGWTDSAHDSYHPDMRNGNDIPMTSRPRSSII
jgi:hypothetical protein